MKKIILSICTLSLAISAATAQTLDRSQRPKPGPAPEVKLGKTESFTLPNGMKVFVVENHKLPAVNVSIQLDIQPELEGDMAGYQDMFGTLLGTATTKRSKDQINMDIDQIGARIGSSESSIYGNSLKKHQAKLFELMSDIVLNSKFLPEELDKLKTQTLSGLETEKNEPDAMLRNLTAVINFGTNHPYGEVSTDQTIKNVTLAKIENFYKTYWHPNVAYMAIVGDVTMAEVKPMVEKYFSAWKKADVPVTKYPDVKATSGGTRVAMAPREAAVQSVFNVTYPIDLKPGSPDVVKARVANTILGGGSSGRLFQNLREAHGWTYGSYSDVDEDEFVGAFTAYAKCRNEVTDSALTETIKEIGRMSSEPVPDAELKNTIAYMTGGFSIGLEDPSRVAQYAINIERYNMPKDYYQNYLKNLSAVTAADVQNISKKYITPANANIVIVGNQDETAEKLKRFASNGQVSFYDNYGRPMEVTKKAAAPAGLTADDVMKKFIAAMGGEAGINSVKDIKAVYEGEIQGMVLRMTETKKAGGKMSQVMELPAMGMVAQKSVVNGDKGYQEQQGQRKDLEGDDLKTLQEEADLAAMLHPEKYGYKRTLAGMDKVNGADAYILEVVNTAGDKSKEFYDAQTGLLVKKITMMEGPQGDMPVTTEYSDYQAVPGTSGYKVAGTVKSLVGPENMALKLKTVEANKNVADTDFQ